MSKRKCVRRAIIEISDSDAEGSGDDECVAIVGNTGAASSRRKINSLSGESRSKDRGGNKRPRRSRSAHFGESQELSNDESTKESPVVKLEKPKVKREKPIVKREKPIVKREKPIVKREKPIVKREKPIVKREKPIVKRESPIVKRESPIVKRESPIVKPEASTGVAKEEKSGERSRVKEESPIVKREARIAVAKEEKSVKRKISESDSEMGSCLSHDSDEEDLRDVHQEPRRQRRKVAIEPRAKPRRAYRQRSATPEAKMQRCVSPQAKPQPDDTAESYVARLQASGIRCVEWSVVDYVREENRLSHRAAENAVKLLEEDNTIPFIARYRKDMTQGLEAEELRGVKNSYERAKLIKQRAASIIKEIDSQGKWTAEIHAFVQGTKSLNDLEYIHSMFKIVKSTLVERAKAVGLGVPAEAVFYGQRMEPLGRLVRPQTEGLRNEEQVRDGVVCIVADMINKDRRTFERIQQLRRDFSMEIETTKTKSPASAKGDSKTEKQKDDETKYDLYHQFSSNERHIKPHQILAINRGEARKVLSVKINVPNGFEQALKGHCFHQYAAAINASHVHRELITAAIDRAINKSIKPSVRRRTRQEMNERAEVASMDVFAENVKQLLLTPPVRGKVVLGVDPGFRHGCKLAVVSEQGDLLETETIYPHDANNPKARLEAERKLVELVLRHKCAIFALGNGTACRETEVFLAGLIKRNVFEPLDIVYNVVDETGASIYSCSPEAAAEFPGLNVNVVSAVSIARRLQDPMAELVKVEPKHLGVGMYQHDLPEKQLAAKLNDVIMEAVSFVGVDVNTASVSLLKRVAGLGESKAKNIIEHRKTSGPFRSRKELTKVKGIGNKTFEQCAGFIRVMPETAVGSGSKKAPQEPFNYLDQTWIHPESYEVAQGILRAAKCNITELGTRPFIFAMNLYAGTLGHEALARNFGATVETIEVIVKGLTVEKGFDIRAKGDVNMFRKSLTSMDDLKAGVMLTGVVRNITHFGAFVDVGVERNGLIHKSHMSGTTLNVGQRVEAKVMNVDKERGRIGLMLVRCV